MLGNTMPDFIYSIIPILAIVIHLIINFDMLPGRKKVSTFHCAREFRGFLGGLLYFYVTDALWGIFAEFVWTKILYLDTQKGRRERCRYSRRRPGRVGKDSGFRATVRLRSDRHLDAEHERQGTGLDNPEG